VSSIIAARQRAATTAIIRLNVDTRFCTHAARLPSSLRGCIEHLPYASAAYMVMSKTFMHKQFC
jgi:hypothetical protein